MYGNCNTQFRVTTGTIFESSKIPLTDWFLAIKLIACLKKGMSSHKLAKEIGITEKSAWYMEQNIRLMLDNKEYNHMLIGKIKVDEVYMVRDTSIPTKQGHGTNKQKVFGMRQRNSKKNEAGELRIQVVPKVKQKVLHPFISDNVKLRAWLVYHFDI